MLVPAIALLLLSACGSGGGGGGGVVVVPLPTTVFVDDAPIIGALVQDGVGNPASPSLSASGEYRFDSAPTLPLKISSRNIVGADGRVAVVQIGGLWYSYEDRNNNGRWDDGIDPVQPLTFQDLDGNGLYTQSVDIVFNGSFLVNYVKPGATVIQANVVASLLPRTWNGATPVAGVSAAALNAAVSVGPTNSASAGSGTTPAASAELRRAAAVLTAISEGLVSTLRTSTTNTTAQTQTTINNALSAIANSGVNVTATDTTGIGQVAAAVAGSVPQAATQANNLVSNVMSIASGTTSNFEAVVKVTQERLSDVVSAPQQTQQDKLKGDVQLAASAIGAAQAQAVPNKDPDADRIAALRLIPLGIPDVSASNVQESWISLASTSGFSLERQPDGSMQFRASGVPFQDVLGATSKNIPFVSSRNSWEYTGPLNEKLKIRVNVSIPKGLFNPNLGVDAGAYNDASSMQLCTSQGACVYYFMFSPAQLCNPDWQAMVALGTVSSEAKTKFYTALNNINVGPNRPAVSCP
jgi:hypothetical protein